MKLLRFSVIALLAALSATFIGGCSDDKGLDNRDTNYGYVQFKLYKEASYTESSRALKPQLDYLAEASKLKVTLTFQGTTISQTLLLSAADSESAEFGLRSEKLRLLAGQYKLITFTLYDANDEPIYNAGDDAVIDIVAGGLAVQDIEVDVEPRGKVLFTLVKDFSDFSQTPDVTRSVSRQYNFDEISFIDITVKHSMTNELTTFKTLKTKFSIHFDDDDDTFGYQTSTSICDTLLSLKAGDYSIASYEAFDKNKTLLESNKHPKNSDFTVRDNQTAKPKVGITLYEADEYIRDYYALYEIWLALDGPNWYYSGQNHPEGCNWDFNKDPDLWGYQPGVEVHANGRVAKISIGDFGFRGHLPAAIGQMSEMIELYLGSHNDMNLLEYDPSLAFDKSVSERTRTRMERNKEYLGIIHTPTQFSEPIARALKEHNIWIPAISLYDDYTESEIFDPKTGLQRRIRPLDVEHGKLLNGLKSIDPAIGKLEKLEFLYIANGELESLPAEVANLKSVTDFELYNCPKMTRFPVEIAQMPELVSINISNNAQWSPEEIYRGLDALASGPSKEKIQILYSNTNSLKEVPASFSNLKKLGLLDMSDNQIETISPLGKEVSPVQFFLNNNRLTSLPTDASGIFCTTDDIEIFSVTDNKLTKVPNIFSAKHKYTMGTIDFSNNNIDGFEGEEDGTYRGLNAKQFSLAGNPKLTKFPLSFAKTNSLVTYIILRGCSIDEIPEGAFTSKYASSLISLDLTYNNLTKLPKDFSAEALPYLYGLDVSYNAFNKFPWEALNCSGLTVFAVRGQRDAQGNRCLREWALGVYQHTGLRGLYLGSNDLRKIEDTISYLIYHLDISDNPNITFDASGICYYWQQGVYNLIYDKSQNILNCDKMLE